MRLHYSLLIKVHSHEVHIDTTHTQVTRVPSRQINDERTRHLLRVRQLKDVCECAHSIVFMHNSSPQQRKIVSFTLF